MDESSLEDKLNEFVKEFGNNFDPNHKKLADLAKLGYKSVTVSINY